AFREAPEVQLDHREVADALGVLGQRPVGRGLERLEREDRLLADGDQQRQRADRLGLASHHPRVPACRPGETGRAARVALVGLGCARGTRGAAGRRTVTRSPPAGRGARVRLPSCASAMLLTIARPRPTPAWSLRLRSVPRRNGSASMATTWGVSCSPVFSTVSTALVG